MLNIPTLSITTVYAPSELRPSRISYFYSQLSPFQRVIKTIFQYEFRDAQSSYFNSNLHISPPEYLRSREDLFYNELHPYENSIKCISLTRRDSGVRQCVRPTYMPMTQFHLWSTATNITTKDPLLLLNYIPSQPYVCRFYRQLDENTERRFRPFDRYLGRV